MQVFQGKFFMIIIKANRKIFKTESDPNSRGIFSAF